MEIILIRHGPTDYNLQRRWQGRVDIPLNPTGIELADAIGGFLRSQNTCLDHIYVSPLVRAVETANAIASDSSSIIVDDRLIEIDLGQYDGRHEDEIRQEVGAQEYDLWRSSNFRTPAPGGESFEQLQKRIGEFFADVAATNETHPVIVVAHQGVLMALKSVISGDSSQQALNGYKQRNDVVEVWNTITKRSVSVWEIKQDGLSYG